MASINKLSIRGVRAFSPEDDEQVIEFMFPFTIIVGANGCGKTTVIECLKYAVTGSLPPGAKAGQSFIHDPQSIGQANVKANIKLRFTNRAGNSMVMVRSMEVTQKKSTLTFKALDGVLRTTNPDTGERISMSHKCSEMDRQLPLLLGVTSPILEHVVFCHQEDSSWPLQQSSDVKKKFDDIFDSTRYAKALKHIMDIKKEYVSKAKDLKADVALLAGHQHAAKGFRHELDELQEELEEFEEELAKNREAMKLAEQKKADATKVLDQIEEVTNEIEDAQTSLDAEMMVMTKQKSMLGKDDLTGKHTHRELKEMLGDFDDEMRNQVVRKDDLANACKRLKGDIEGFYKEESKLQGTIGKVVAEREQHEYRVKQRLAKMEKIADIYGIELAVTQTQNAPTMSGTQGTSTSDTVASGGTQNSVISISEEDMEAFMNAVRRKETDFSDSLKNHKSQAQFDEDRMTVSLSDLLAKQKAIESDCEKNAKEQQSARQELSNLNSQHSSVSRIRKSDIEEIRRQAESFAKRRDEANNDPRKTEIPLEIRSLDEKIDKLKRLIDDDQQVLRDLRRCADAHNEIEVLKDQSTKDIDNLRDFIRDNSFDFQKYNIQIPDPIQISEDDEAGEVLVEKLEKLASFVSDRFDDASNTLSKTAGDITSKQQIVSQKSALLTHNHQTFESLAIKIKVMNSENGSYGKYQRIIKTIKRFELENGFSTTIDENDPQSAINHITAQLENINEQSVEGLTGDVLFKLFKQIKKLAKIMDDHGELQDVICPCCTRSFNKDMDSIKIFQDTMAGFGDKERSPLLQLNKENANRVRAAKKNYQTWRNSINEIIPELMEHARITAELGSLEATISEMTASVLSHQSQLDTLNEEHAATQIQFNDFRSLVELTKRWLDEAGKIAGKKMRISQKNTDLSLSMTSVSNTNNRNLRTVERDVESKMEEKDNLMNKINRLNKEMSAINTNIGNISTQAANTEQRVREKEIKYAEERKAQERKDELQEIISRCGELDKELHENILKLKPVIKKKENEKQKHRDLAKDEEDRLSGVLINFNNDVSDLRSLNTEIIRNAKRCIDSNSLEALNEEIDKLKGRVAEKRSQLQELEPELESLNRSIEDQERHRKLIQENISLLEATHRIEDLKKEIESFENEKEKIEGYDTAAKELDEASARIVDLLDKKARKEGRRSGSIEQIRTLKRKLTQPEYKDIDERHRQARIKQETTVIACSDLEKYHNALDKALIRYHGIKIGEINKIIRELWTLTYKVISYCSLICWPHYQSNSLITI